jgi:protoporphyrin/coproporphyrin ferrochelatase
LLGVIALNLGGPTSLEEVEPFLERLFADPDVIQLGWMSFLQKPLARFIARRRAPESRKAYAEIGGRSPILDESTAQAVAIAVALEQRGVPARPYVAMAAWHPFAEETIAAMRRDGIERAVAVPLYPHYSRTTTGSSRRLLDRAAGASSLELAYIERYPDAPGFIEALCDRVEEAISLLPEEARQEAPVLFSAHGLPESYIRRGDPYLDDVRTTVEAVSRQLRLGPRAQLSFQSRVGPQKWLGPYTEQALDALAEAGHSAVAVCPVAFTGEHIETLQEIDILYRQRALQRGIRHFVRARTVGCHPAFIDALAELAGETARKRGWA